jgi:hypothetical protein
MNKIQLLTSDYLNCPICGQLCRHEEIRGYDTPLRVQGTCQTFLCYNPLANDPLHYYNHIVLNSDPLLLAYQEFSLNLGHKYVLFGINYNKNISLIKNQRNEAPLELGFVIVPDFPDLDSLKSKTRTAIVFS